LLADLRQDRLFGAHAATLSEEAKADAAKRAGLSTDVAAKLKALARRNQELRQSNSGGTSGSDRPASSPDIKALDTY